MPNYELWSTESLIDECASLYYMSGCMDPERPTLPDFDSSYSEPFLDFTRAQLIAEAKMLAALTEL